MRMLWQAKKKSLTQHIAIISIAMACLIFDYYYQPAVNYDHVLAKVAAIENGKCPRMIDTETRLDAVVSWPNRTLRYRYTLVNVNVFKIDKQRITDELRTELVAHYKTGERLKAFRNKGVTIEHEYMDKNGIPITEIVVGPKDL